MLRVDAIFDEGSEHTLPKSVISNGSDEAHLSAETCCGHCLIGALASRDNNKIPAADGLSGKA